MKKILFLTNYASPYMVDFFNELGKFCEVTVLFTDRTQDQKHRSQQWFSQDKTVNFKSIQLNKKLGFKSACVYLDVLNYLNRNYDAIVICGYGTPFTMPLAVEYLKFKKIPFYMEIDGGLIKQDPWWKYHLKRHWLSMATYWFSSGKETTKYLLHYGADKNRIIGYPFSSLRKKDILQQVLSVEQKQILRKQLGITENKVIVSVGQFVYRKGYDVLLKASVKLPKSIGVYIIGDKPTPEYLKLQNDFSLTQVHFVGFQPKEELKKWYQAADAFVLPTREDVWGLVINEAMAQGLPVITTDKCVAGVELVENGVNGYIVPTNDAQALEKAITTLFTQDCRLMGQKSLEKIQPYTIENIAKIHMAAFKEI